MPATDRLGAALARGPILLDAAMGTRLMERGLDLAHDDPALWNLTHPNDVLDLHRRDIAAGADALLTNTFGVNRVWLAHFGLAREAAPITQKAVALARIAAGPDRLIFGSIGPTAADHPAAVTEQAEALAESGVDALVLETHRLDQAVSTLRLLRGDLPLPILVSLHDWPEPIAESARRLVDHGARAIGANCQNGMAPALALARKLRDAVPIPLLIKPSAGLPGSPPELPRAFATVIPELLALGVRLVGGCCGTNEAHIATMRTALDACRDIP